MLPLREVDSVEITSLMDNYFDAIIAGTAIAQRPVMARDVFSGPQPRAEHGSAMLITVCWGDRRASLLLDTGATPDGLVHNVEALRVPMPPLEAIVISHGHVDHTAGLLPTLERFGRDVPVYVHPDGFRKRKLVFSDGREVDMPQLDAGALGAHGVRVVASRAPALIVDDRVLLTGEVARTTDFEKGLPTQYSEIGGEWQPDPATNDDQAIAINVRDKGLVVITGCGHAGIVNTLRYVKALTGVELLYAVVGGFHLSGKAFEQIIPPTIEELASLTPQVVIPTHCTGWAASQAIASALPWAYVTNSVGTKYLL